MLAIIAIAAYRSARTTNKIDPLLWAIAAGVCAVTAIAKTEIVWVFLAAGAFGLVYYGGGLPRRSASSAASVSPVGRLAAVKGFALAGVGVGGGNDEVVLRQGERVHVRLEARDRAARAQGLVHDRHWLTEQQFVDAVAMGLISPGPVVIMATFAGYLVDGIAGAAIATVAVFLPVYVFVIVPGRYLRRHGEHASARVHQGARPRRPRARSPARRS